jgi:hypothetical protein
MARTKANVPSAADNGQPLEGDFPFGANAPAESVASPIEAAGPPASPSPSPSVLDPFDPNTYRLQPSLLVSAGVEKHITDLPVRKPDKSWWVRVHPEPEYSLSTFVIELKEEDETYLVVPPLWQALQGEPTFISLTLHLAVTRQGKPFLWKARRPSDPTQEPTRWMRPTLDAVSRALTRWTRIAWNVDTRQHDVSTCDYSAEPVWPDLPFRELLKIAFRDYIIETLDHPVLRRLRGED